MSLVKTISMMIVADAGKAQETLADIDAKADKISEPHVLKIGADAEEAEEQANAVTDAMVRYTKAATDAGEAALRLAEVQADEGASGADIAAAMDANATATQRAADAQIRLLEAERAQAAGAAEAGDAQEIAAVKTDESAAKTDEGAAAAEGSGEKLKVLALGAGVAAYALVDMAMKFQEGATQLVTGAGQSASGLKQVEAGMLAISSATATSATEVEAGMYMIESAGYHGAQGLAVLKAAAEGARVGNASLAATADAVTTVLTDYHMKATQASSAMSGLVATVAAGKTHLQDLASSLSKVLPTAGVLKVPFDQVAGAMATMTAEGVTARLAATHLNSTLIALANPSATAAKAMDSVGLSSTEVANKLKSGGLVAALEMVTDAAGKKFPAGSSAYVAAVDKMLGGQAGLAVALELTGGHLSTLKADIAAVAAAMNHGRNDVEGFGDASKDASFKMEQVKIEAENLGIAVGSALLPAITKVAGVVADFAGKLAGSKTGVDILAGAIGAVLVGFAIAKAVEGFQKISGAISTVSGSFSALIGKFTASGAASAEAAAGTEELAAAETEQAAAAEEATGAQEGLDAAMDANPVGAVVALIALLVGAVIMAYTHFKTFRDVVNDAWHAVGDAVKVEVAIWVAEIRLMVAAAEAVAHGVVTAFDFLKAGVVSVVGDAIRFVESVPGKIKSVFDGAAGWLLAAGEAVVEGLIHGIESMVGSVLHAAEDVGHAVMSGVKDVLSIFSPSREMRLLGQYAGQGLALGLTDTVPAVLMASRQLAHATSEGYAGVATAAAGGGGRLGGGGIVGDIHINFNGITGDPTAAARQVVGVLRQYKRNGGGAPLGIA